MKRTRILKPPFLPAFSCLLALLLSYLSFLFPISSFASDESICAEVKLDVKQGMTLERQAFDAHMRISNGFSHITLGNVDVDVRFSDEDGNSVLASSGPNNTEALFFIRLDSMENIDNVNGSRAVQPASTADIHWLIIPAPGASNGLETGTLYYVGATLTYTIGGKEHITKVYPDFILVKPLPELMLDYFLPTDVYGDDAFTPEIEPPIPFSLGVRVRNNGTGVARSLKIDSAQLKIVENEQGLLIGFVVEGCEVNGNAATRSLMADFGDIEPNASGVARWIMTCTLSGQFVEFNAEYSHSDELGGELTSLLEAVNTHFLVRDVLVDLPGRDDIRDFLAEDGAVYTVYESDSVDTSVLNQSASSSLQLAGQSGSEVRYTLSTPVTAGFMYAQLPDPHGGDKVLTEVVRSDGKYIKAENAWLSKTRDGDNNWQHFINLFDVNTTNGYTVVFHDATAMPDAPVLQFIPDGARAEGEQLSFIVEASDPDGTVPSLSAAPVPALATFVDQGDGVGTFDWTSQVGQAGRYEITFRASDGILEDSQRVVLTIYSMGDTDGDGMADDWEMEHFGTLDRDGTGDFDGDGISDLDEYLNGTDPTSSNAPSIPEIFSPEDKAEVTGLQPDLLIQNSIDPDDDPITYEFEVYSDEAMGILVASQLNVVEGDPMTSWTVSAELNDNSWYYWRVRATDGIGFSQWAYGSFFVNTENEPPGSFNISSPQDDSDVDTVTPDLEVTNSVDVDEDVLTYTFEIYADGNMSTLIAFATNIPEGEGGTTSWVVDSPLDDNTWYFWKAIATDEHGASTETTPASFFVNTFNDAPEIPAILSPAIGSEVQAQELDLTVNNAFDPDGDLLTYFFELDRLDTFDSAEKQISGEISEGVDTTSWHVAGLDDNTNFFWRAKASDGYAESPWALGDFFVNTANDSPSIPTLKNPGEGAWVETLTPTLELNPSVDVDNDSLTYQFQLYSDGLLNNLVDEGTCDVPTRPVSFDLNDNSWYFWRAQAEDEHGAASGWTNMASFFVNNNGYDDPPKITVTEPSTDIVTSGTHVTISWEDTDPDSNADIALYYDTDSSGEDGILIVAGLKEDPDGESDSSSWDISGMADGTYYVYATITDGTSSATSYAQGAIIIDRTPPTVTALPPGGTYSETQSVTLSASEAADIYYTTDGGDPTTDSLSYTSPIEITETATLRFMAVDAAGNQSTIGTEIYTIGVPANVPPEAHAGDDVTISLGDEALLDGSASNDPDDGPGPFTCSWEFLGLPPESALTDADISGVDTLSPSFMPDVCGTYELELTVSDGLDLASDTVMVTVETGAAVAGDLDGDSDVDYDDYLVFRTAYGSCEGDANFLAGADLDGDGCVTINDYRILRSLIS